MLYTYNTLDTHISSHISEVIELEKNYAKFIVRVAAIKYLKLLRCEVMCM